MPAREWYLPRAALAICPLTCARLRYTFTFFGSLMTAALVVVIWAVAGPALVDLFEQAISRVSGI